MADSPAALCDAWRALLLLVAANATPVLVARWAHPIASWPLDFGRVMADGQRLFSSPWT